jgi:hypothetical protein
MADPSAALVRHVDVCNGDADGLCALHQLRLAEPRSAELVTGLKREIGLLSHVKAEAGLVVTVLDLSLDRNRAALMNLLEAGASVRYFDHHFAGSLPQHERLQAVIDPSPGICTSMLVDRWLNGAYRRWAVVGAFGDNLLAPARELANVAGLDPAQREKLRELGTALNYNAYGETEADVAFHPRALYRLLQRYPDPFDFYASEPAATVLLARCRDDIALAEHVASSYEDAHCAIYKLPDSPWSRRVLGAFANRLAERHPQRAHAVLKANADGSYRASIRAPLESPYGADALCRRFAGGGGRAGAGGFERLPAGELDRFFVEFVQTRWKPDSSP